MVAFTRKAVFLLLSAVVFSASAASVPVQPLGIMNRQAAFVSTHAAISNYDVQLARPMPARHLDIASDGSNGEAADEGETGTKTSKGPLIGFFGGVLVLCAIGWRGLRKIARQEPIDDKKAAGYTGQSKCGGVDPKTAKIKDLDNLWRVPPKNACCSGSDPTGSKAMGASVTSSVGFPVTPTQAFEQGLREQAALRELDSMV
jgi:hypothetical protein